MLTLQSVTYIHPNKELLFADLNFSVNKHDKIALIGNNGAGKSTLLQISAGNLLPASGHVKATSKPYYVPQHFGQYNNYTVAQALQVNDKLQALTEILDGHVTDQNMTLLNDDWTIEERCAEALAHWALADISLDQQMNALSGGQKTKVFLAGISIHRPEIILLDEPSNHLDTVSREILYQYIQTTTGTLVVVSHDRALLNLLDPVCELGKRGITTYGGNYDFYAGQKLIESEALNQDVRGKEKALRKARDTERETVERQQKLDARGKKKQEKAGVPTIMMKTLKNNAEKSTSRIQGVHTEKIGAIAGELSALRRDLPDVDKMKMDFDNSALHKGKLLITAKNINFGYSDKPLWKQPLNFQITSGERLVIKGPNGGGKTTLIKMILGTLHPNVGSIEKAAIKTIYIDQDYSLIDSSLTVYEQAQHFNSGALQEHDIKIRLNRFLFGKAYWDKPCAALSGGEKMRLSLCSLNISNQAPDIIVLDEPTNNLDLQNIQILTSAINQYQGTLIVVSHDAHFLQEVNVGRVIDLG
jgi:ATPase subunit of ABC transporter with duplicated ATPase domains